MKKITFIIPSVKGGGSEKVVINIVKYLNRNKFQTTLIVVDLNGPYLKDIPADIEIVNLGHKRLRYSIIALSRELLRIKPDYVFSTLGYLNFLLILISKLLRLKSKIVIRESSTPTQYITRLSLLRKVVYARLYKKLYPKADIIIAQCDSMKQDLVENFDIDKTKVKRIYNPIDLNMIVNQAINNNPYDSNFINIVAVGRLVYAKGYDILLNSFKKLIKRVPNIKLTILGDGPLRDELIELATELDISNRVKFIGFVENPYPYINNAELYVLSSRWEGFPNTLLEALACGTKSIATDCISGPREILGNNKYGLLAKNEDSESLYLAMLEYLNSENRSGSRANDFSIEKIIYEYEEIFK